MRSTPTDIGDGDRALMPRGVRRAVLALLGVLMLGAAYLAAVRGDAILLDLAGLANLFCL